jgi:hypothetical protein
VAGAIAVQKPVDRLYPLPAFAPDQDIETLMEDFVGRRSRIEDVIAIARRIRAAEHPRRVEPARRSRQHLDERSLLHRHRAHEDSVSAGNATPQGVVRRPIDVEVDQLERPLIGHQRRERE